MSYNGHIPAFSVLDLAQVKVGSSIASSFAETLAVAQHAERLGYKRFWLAEHHNMAGVASAATAVLIGHVAGGTSKIRVGSGGVMLPNHPPLVIAEQFGTLETLYPGRIDLGLGRAPGTDGPTLRALRRRPESAEDFPEQVEELLGLLEPPAPGQVIRAVPGAGTRVPVWLLGSSTFSAQLAAQLGLPFAFAAHFAPQQMRQALHLYRTTFQASHWLEKPYALICIPVIAAETDAEAEVLSSTVKLKFLDIIRGTKDSLLRPPVPTMVGRWSEQEEYLVHTMLGELVGGSARTLELQLAALIASTRVDEIMISCTMYDQAARLRSYDLFAEVMRGISGRAADQGTAPVFSEASIRSAGL